MGTPRLIARLVRIFYRHFYNRLAFTYDPISALVSRGEWHAWTAAAIPFIQGTRILEVAFGTGNLQLDLRAAGYDAVGVDLSPDMIRITRAKLSRAGYVPALVRGRVQSLPFPDSGFDSIIMTFPPGFVTDARAMGEMHRVIAPGGRLVWVDSPYLSAHEPWTRFLNWAYHLTNAGPEAGSPDIVSDDGLHLKDLLSREGWSWQVKRIERPRSSIHVFVGTREGGNR